MKKILFSIISVTLLVAACERNSQPEIPAPDELVTIRATFPEGADLKGAGLQTILSWTWNAGDKLTVIGETTETFSIKDGFTPKQAEFVGKAVKGNSFTILYPGESANSTDWNGQTQTGDGNIDHLRYEAALNAVDDYTSFAFSADWAEEHGGSLKQTGVVKFDMTLPDEVADVSSVSLSATDAIFYGGNDTAKTDKLTLNVVGADVTDHHLTAYMTSSWNEATISAGTDFVVSVKTSGKVYTQTLSKTEDAVLKTGFINTITLTDASKWRDDTPRYTSGTGTETDPWVITTSAQMLLIAEDLSSAATRYFKLGADIDMAGVEWTPLNTADPYDQSIVFDGDGHSISNFSCSASKYPSMFGVLYGEVKNLTFKNASINNTAATATGVVAGYFGTGNKTAKAVNVHVEGTVNNSGAYAGIGGVFGKAAASAYDSPAISGCSFKGTLSSTGAKNGVGGIIGVVQNLIIEKSWVDATITNNANYVGGIVGYESAEIEIRDCWSAGSISGSQRIGGIIGGVIKNNTAVRRCYSTASISASACLGGIVAHASLDKWSATTSEPGNVVENCIAWNSSIRSTQAQQTEYTEQGSSGAIVGYTSIKNTLKGCIRKPDIDFAEKWAGNVPFDQEDASAGSPLVEPQTLTYFYPYHGKAAASGATVSTVAQGLGWSADIWDFSDALPKLK